MRDTPINKTFPVLKSFREIDKYNSTNQSSSMHQGDTKRDTQIIRTNMKP
jgi:hypothetical protein